MTRRKLALGGLFAFLGVLVVAGAAHAFGGGDDSAMHRFFRARMEKKLDGILDDIKATPQQRAVVKQAEEKIVAAVRQAAAEHRTFADTALDLFAQDRLDVGRIDELADARLQAMRDTHRQVRSALADVHAALGPQQRVQVVAKLRELRDAHHRGPF
jgi:Spy/CpxP family protein refolding chaperone